MNTPDEFKARFFPEVLAGGFSHVDGTIAFYNRVHALLHQDAVVLDFGAGPGTSIEHDRVPWRKELRVLRGKCLHVVGIDIDTRVRGNPFLDEAHVANPDDRLPLGDESVDLIVCDSVLEHIDNPEWTTSELSRVLKRGGWICARTPNRWGYIGIATNLVPNRFHAAIVARVQPERNSEGVYPTFYKLNTKTKIRRHFKENDFLCAIHTMNSEPAYFGQSRVFWQLLLFLFRLTPKKFGATLFVFLRKCD